MSRIISSVHYNGDWQMQCFQVGDKNITKIEVFEIKESANVPPDYQVVIERRIHVYDKEGLICDMPYKDMVLYYKEVS